MLPSMFGMGGSEIIVILVIALIFLGPDKLPDATKQISKGIRDLRRATREIQSTIEADEHIGGALRDIKSALRGEDPAERPKVVRQPALVDPTTPSSDDEYPEHDENGNLIAPVSVKTVAAVTAAAAPTAVVDSDATVPTPAPVGVRLPVTAGEADHDDDLTGKSTADERELADGVQLAGVIKPAFEPIPRQTPAVVTSNGTEDSKSNHG